MKTKTDFISFQNKFSTRDFPLTRQMIEKNDYSNHNVYYITDNDGLAAVGIYEDLKDCIHLDVLEVRNDCQCQSYGTNVLNKLKAFNKKIYVRSLPEAVHFYLKNDFSWKYMDGKNMEFVYEVEHD